MVATSSASGSGLAGVLDAATFNALFPNRSGNGCHASSATLFTYANFVSAAAAFPSFGSTGDVATRKREVAAFLANAGHETTTNLIGNGVHALLTQRHAWDRLVAEPALIGHETTGGWGNYDPLGTAVRYNWGFCFSEEVRCAGTTCPEYGVAGNGETYHGRGPLQLSHSYNYAAAGSALGLSLASNPDLLLTDGVASFKAALWFWMTAQSPKPSAHDVMVLGTTGGAGRPAGFGLTINIINGGIECGHADDRVKDRIGFFTKFTAAMGTTMGANVDCYTQTPY